MEFFSEQFFLDQARLIPLNEQREFSTRVRDSHADAKFDVFLSYNIKNIEAVKAIYFFLTKKGLKVYLDCIVDPDMQRDNCGKPTAQRIHNRLMNSKSLLYAQSSSAGNSNWMPWELGVVDGHTHKCFIMPVTSDAKQVTPKREYLSLYPYVKPDSYNTMKIFSEDTEARPIIKDFVQFIKGFQSHFNATHNTTNQEYQGSDGAVEGGDPEG